MFTVADFLEASDYERSVLEIVSPLVNSSGARSGFDLRSTTINFVAQDIVIGQSSAGMLRELRPLFFGAAWKVLDLLVEFGLNQGQAQKHHMRIADKARDAAHAIVPPLSNDPDLWDRLTTLYSATVDIRHCLVHRRFAVNTSGTMTDMVDKNNNTLQDVTSAEQLAFCRVSLSCARAVQSPASSNRSKLDLLWSLDELSKHHKCTKICKGPPAYLPEVIKTNATRVDSGWVVDLDAAHKAARTILPGRPYYDLEIYFPDSGIPPIVGRLEDAPEGRDFPLDPTSPPQWVDV